MLKLGSTSINKAYLGSAEIRKLYLGSTLLYDTTPSGKPVLSNFRVENANTDRVLFDASASVAGMTSTGFTISGKTISSLTIDGDGLGGYFTVSSAFTYWDNNTIRLEGGDGTVYNFRLQHIENNINELTPSGYKYVTTTGGTGAGTLGDPWSLSHALANATAGTKVYVKAGDYGSSGYTLTVQGNSANPIWFEGYETTPGDNPSHTFTNNVTLSASKMPLIATGSQSGRGFDANGNDYIFFRNFQIDKFYFGATFGGSNYVVLENVYIQGSYTNFDLWSDNGCVNARVLNCHAQDATHEGFYNRGLRNLIEGCYASSSFAVGMDYYFLTVGSSLGSGQHILRNNVANRYSGDSHPGHGFDLKRQHTNTVIQYCLIEDCTAYNMGQTMSFRHPLSSYNVARNIEAYGNRSEGNLVTFRDGCDNNVIEDSYGENIDVGIKLRNNPGEKGVQASGSDNRVENCIVNGCDWIMDEAVINGAVGNMLQTTGLEILNCTFHNVANGVFDANGELGLNSTNILRKNIINDGGNSIIGTFSPTIENNVLWNTPALSSYYDDANGNVEVDPTFVSESDPFNFRPQATFTSIQASRIPSIKYDYNNSERSDPTTIGAVKSADE
jgi:hypothetical protein